MGALTIKSYAFEMRLWELSQISLLNIYTSYPSFLLLLIKNARVVRIFPCARNDFISNYLRFSFAFQNAPAFLVKMRNFICSFFSYICYIYSISRFIFNSFAAIFSFVFIYNFQLLFNFSPNSFLLPNMSSWAMITSRNQFWALNFFFGSFYSFDQCLRDNLNYFMFNLESKFIFPDFFYNLIKPLSYYTLAEIAASADEAILGEVVDVSDKCIRMFFSNLSTLFIDYLFYYYFLCFKYDCFSNFFLFLYSNFISVYSERLRSFFPFVFGNTNSSFSVSCIFSFPINSLGFLITDLNSKKLMSYVIVD